VQGGAGLRHLAGATCTRQARAQNSMPGCTWGGITARGLPACQWVGMLHKHPLGPGAGQVPLSMHRLALNALGSQLSQEKVTSEATTIFL